MVEWGSKSPPALSIARIMLLPASPPPSAAPFSFIESFIATGQGNEVHWYIDSPQCGLGNFVYEKLKLFRLAYGMHLLMQHLYSL